MDTPSGMKDSIPAWIKFSVQAPGEIPYNGIYYDPPEEVYHLIILGGLEYPSKPFTINFSLTFFFAICIRKNMCFSTHNQRDPDRCEFTNPM